MGMVNTCCFLLLLFFPALCQADCETFFTGFTIIEINDNNTYEPGTVIGDYSDKVDNKTLIFLNGNCASLLALNGSKLVLKENLLNPALCNFESVSCEWCCAELPARKHSLRVVINRVSRGIFKFKNNSYSVNVPESASTGTELVSFSKSDLTREDCVPLTNVFFRLTGNEENFFGSRTGTDKITLFLNKKLDYEDSKNHTLNITAELLDASEENSTSLLVNVTDVDDMDPTFDHDVYYLNITENDNASINVSLNVTPNIHAFDRDTGAGRQEVFYRFADDSNKHGCFAIDKATGNISVSCPYDREEKEFYSLTIKAVQRNTDSRSCTATLSVRILDVNDNVPEFTLTSYHVNVTEHSGRGTLIDTVTAKDKDQDEKAQDVDYEILPPHNTAFSVNKNGEIRVEDPSKLDREAGNGTMILKVKAIDSENRKPSTSTATVLITLLDANDNAPIFDAPKYTFRLSSDPSPGDELGQVKAVDADEANTPNSEIRYKFHKTLWSSSFSIDNKTGKITVKERPTISTGQIELIVEAQDLGFPPLRSSVAVLLSQVAVNGNTVNFTVLKSAEDVTKKKEFFQSEIGKILKLQVTIDQINSLRSRKNSCYIIVSAKFQNNTDVTGIILENLVLQHMSEILALFNEPHETQKAVSSEETFTPTVISLIVICCLLIVGTIILIIYIQQSTKKFERVKRLQDNLTRKSSLYESQELKIQMPDEQTSDYNGSLIGSQDLPSLRNSSGDLKERVVSAYTNSVFSSDETSVNLTVAEKEAEKSLNDLTNVLDAEETKVMVVDSYNPSESDTEFETEGKISQGYENAPYPPGYENVPHKFKSDDVPEDYPTGDPNESEFGRAENQENKQIEEDEEPNPDYDVKAVRFSAQVLDTEENKFEPLREKEDHAELKKDEESGEDIDDDDDDDEDHEDEESTADVNEEVDERKDDKEDDFGDGIESERTDEEILSPNETLHDDNNPEEDAIPHFSFDTKM